MRWEASASRRSCRAKRRAGSLTMMGPRSSSLPGLDHGRPRRKGSQPMKRVSAAVGLRRSVRHPRGPRRLLVVVTGTAVVAGLSLVAPVAASAAPGVPAASALPAGCSQTGPVAVCRFSYTGAEQSLTLPAGVSSVDVVAVGAAGGSDLDNAHPGGTGCAGRGDVVRAGWEDAVCGGGAAPGHRDNRVRYGAEGLQRRWRAGSRADLRWRGWGVGRTDRLERGRRVAGVAVGRGGRRWRALGDRVRCCG